jgi:ribulose 1,5-bisphosphate carboxylase large subunit-like protein
MKEAWNAAMQGIKISKHALNHPELATALKAY